MFQPNRNTKAGIAVRIVGRAVQRIDDPAPINLRSTIVRLAGTGFFSQNAVTRIVSFNPIDDQTFRSKIRFSHQIDFTLVSDLDLAAKAFGQQAARIAGSLNSKVEQRFPLRSSVFLNRFTTENAELHRHQ